VKEEGDIPLSPSSTALYSNVINFESRIHRCLLAGLFRSSEAPIRLL